MNVKKVMSLLSCLLQLGDHFHQVADRPELYHWKYPEVPRYIHSCSEGLKTTQGDVANLLSCLQDSHSSGSLPQLVSLTLAWIHLTT